MIVVALLVAIWAAVGLVLGREGREDGAALALLVSFVLTLVAVAGAIIGLMTTH